VVQGVEAALRSALTNLVGNAPIHTRGARRIAARLTHGSVSISDDGAGISLGYEPKLIEPFQTGNHAKKGAGLGLSIVKEIMAAHRGELVITSTAEHGTTARVRFPEALAPRESESRYRGNLMTALSKSGFFRRRFLRLQTFEE
jgi:signal transduction histidine kinase